MEIPVKMQRERIRLSGLPFRLQRSRNMKQMLQDNSRGPGASWGKHHLQGKERHQKKNERKEKRKGKELENWSFSNYFKL